jgi:transposase
MPDVESTAMSTRYRAYAPEQPCLLPSAPQDWMPEDHLAYVVRDVVRGLDLAAFHRSYINDPRGAPPFDPAMMVSLLLYSWCSDVYSSRRIAMLCVGDLGGRYLAAGEQPDFRTISGFRLRHGDALADLFVQSVQLCQAAGMVSLGHVAVDGTKLAANASKRKAMSYGRMVRAEADLRAEIAEIQRRSQEEDAREDGLFGKDSIGFDLPKELKFRETRLARILEAKAQLEADARMAAEAKAAERLAKAAERENERPSNDGKPRGGRKPKDPAAAVPKESAQRGFTDPDSRIMKSGTGEWVQGYNAQAAVDRDHQVIVACELTNMAADAPHLQPLMEQVARNTGGVPIEQSADAGYFSAENVQSQSKPYSQPYIPPDRLKHGRDAVPVFQDTADADLSVGDRMRKLLSTPEGRKAYANRMKTVEPVFGQIKGCPGAPGFRSVLRRGLTKARQEWKWQCATHNLLKYMRLQVAIRSAQ